MRALYEPAVRPVIPGGPPGAPDDRATAATIFETQPPSVMAPVPRAQWPAWASALAQQGHPSERGVGDTVARVLPPSSAAFQLWHAETFGVWAPSCQCAGKRAAWNAHFPYGA